MTSHAKATALRSALYFARNGDPEAAAEILAKHQRKKDKGKQKNKRLRRKSSASSLSTLRSILPKSLPGALKHLQRFRAWTDPKEKRRKLAEEAARERTLTI